VVKQPEPEPPKREPVKPAERPVERPKPKREPISIRGEATLVKAQNKPDPNETQRRREQAEQIQRAMERLSQSLSGSTSVNVPGPGRESSGSYAAIVKLMYEQAWQVPSEVSANSAVVKVRVVIRRDGRVIDAKILNHSGINAVDQSVENALQLRDVRPFPEGSTDLQRAFEIEFDLQKKRSFQ